MSPKLFYIISYLCAHGTSKYTNTIGTRPPMFRARPKERRKPLLSQNRCHVILLKAEGRTSKDVGLITGMSHISVNHWVARFKAEGISVLHNKPGQGRKPVLDEQDKESLPESVKRHRQRVQTAKAEWESSRGKLISDSTLRRFLKVLTEDING